MQLTAVVQLQTTPEQHAALVQTLRTCNARTFRKYDLHHLTYHNVKVETELAAGHVVCAIAKVANSYKRDT
jgi:hypothetical protein